MFSVERDAEAGVLVDSSTKFPVGFNAIRIRRDKPDTIFFVLLGKANANRLTLTRRYESTYEVGANRNFPVTAIDQDKKANRGGSAEIQQCVEGCPEGSTGKKHVIDEYDMPIGYIERHIGGSNGGTVRANSVVVSVKGGVEDPKRQSNALYLVDLCPQASGQNDPPALQTDEPKRVSVTARVEVLDNLPGHSVQGPIQVGRVHQPGLNHLSGVHDEKVRITYVSETRIDGTSHARPTIQSDRLLLYG